MLKIAANKYFRFFSFLAIALIAGVLYFYEVYKNAAVADHRGLAIASFIKNALPGLRNPLYFPKHSSEKALDERNDALSVAFVSVSRGLPGDCNHFTLMPCQSFAVSTEVLNQPETLSSLLRFIDNPCTFFKGMNMQKGKGQLNGVAERDAQLRMMNQEIRVAAAISFFECTDGREKPAVIILNVMDHLDNPNFLLSESAIRYQIIKQYR